MDFPKKERVIKRKAKLKAKNFENPYWSKKFVVKKVLTSTGFRVKFS